LIAVIFLSLTAAAAAKFIPYIYFYKYNLGEDVGGRVFLASNYEGPPNVDSTNKTTDVINRQRRELIPQKFSSAGFDRENVVILEEPSPISPQFGLSSWGLLDYSAERVVIKTGSEMPKLLFLGDPYYFGWRAKVDGKQVKIFRANYSFRAVPVVGGEHVVEFYYDNWIFKFGAAGGLIGLGMLVYVTRAGSRQKG